MPMEEKRSADFSRVSGVISPEVTPFRPHSLTKELTVFARWGSATVNAVERFISSAPRRSPFSE